METISSAITAAETGHLVFSTLHTIGAAATVDRVIDVFPPHQQQQIRVQLANVLISVISQSLIPTRDGKGRVAAFEIMHTTPAIQNLIRENKTHQISSSIQTSKNMGMITMMMRFTNCIMTARSILRRRLNLHRSRISCVKNYTKYLNSAYCLTTVVENWIVLTKMEKMTQNCLKKQKIWYNF